MDKHRDHVKRLKDFYSNKTVLVTGGAGFKGSWLTLYLREIGAKVFIVDIKESSSIFGASLEGVDFSTFDITDFDKLDDLVSRANPDVVFHLAAQPIVSTGYAEPRMTFHNNIMGTVNLLDSLKNRIEKNCSVINITTDKVYRDVGKNEPYLESDELRGLDPYSASKSCSELISFAFQKSFFNGDSNITLSTARAGNVIGGGDFSTDRIIPDLARSLKTSNPVMIRNPNSVRPYEHVLDALFAYMILAERQYVDSNYSGAYNIGPDEKSIMFTHELVAHFVENSAIQVEYGKAPEFHETEILKLDSSLFRTTFGWRPNWESKKDILNKTFHWYNNWANGMSELEATLEQIGDFNGE